VKKKDTGKNAKKTSVGSHSLVPAPSRGDGENPKGKEKPDEKGKKVQKKGGTVDSSEKNHLAVASA